MLTVSYESWLSKSPNPRRSCTVRLGAAWQHKDGKGFNVQLDCVPLDGRITLRVAAETKE
jgi:hypothetical protein